MKIKKIDGEITYTSKLPKTKRVLVETIEKAEILQQLAKINGCCYVWGYLPDEDNYIWVQQNLRHKDALNKLLGCLNDMVIACTRGKSRLAIVPTIPVDTDEKNSTSQS